MEKLIAFVVVLALFVGIVLGVWWAIWLLWSWFVPQVWPDGPAILVHPGYWFFAAGWMLMAFIGRAIFGGNSK